MAPAVVLPRLAARRDHGPNIELPHAHAITKRLRVFTAAICGQASAVGVRVIATIKPHSDPTGDTRCAWMSAAENERRQTTQYRSSVAS